MLSLLVLSVTLAQSPAATPALAAAAVVSADARPNILWITSEDNGPELGCYGDDYAITPNLDALAAKSLRYDTCWSNAPVCAPARTTIITGMYPPAFGGEHMRSMVTLPDDIALFPKYLADAGYYCTNPGKTDYNVPDPGVWESKPQGSKKGGKRPHYLDRADGQPFFHVYNSTVSHESKIRDPRPYGKLVHDPAEAPVPSYHPDTPEVRMDWAQYYSRITEMDAELGKQLDDLEKNGLADDTIVFYYGDHGSGMPRSKRFPYNSGLHVPLIVHIPEKFAHLRPADYEPGGSTPRLVGFVDLAPTALSLAGVKPPEHMHGQPFCGPHEAEPKRYLYGYRGRMDERIDCIRSVTDGRSVYLRNYMPARPYGQYLGYMFITPTTRQWKDLFDAGELDPWQSAFWQAKPREELYDLKADPDEVFNLVGLTDPRTNRRNPTHEATLKELRGALFDWQRSLPDVGLMPEAMMHAMAEERGVTPYELARDADALPIDSLVASLNKTARDGSIEPDLEALLNSEHAVERFYGVLGVTDSVERVGKAGPAIQSYADQEYESQLEAALDDESWSVRIAAAEVAIRNDIAVELARQMLRDASTDQTDGVNAYHVMAAGNALQQLADDGYDVAELTSHYTDQPDPQPNAFKRPKFGEYVGRIRERLNER